jgi:NADP-dependent 3-hydroxy acid dehydrogenase YdfG
MTEHGVRCTTVAPGGVATDFAIDQRTEDQLAGMMAAQEVADVVLFCVTRPRSMRILTTSFRPMGEPSAG